MNFFFLTKDNTESLYAENIKTLLKLIDFGHVWEKVYIFKFLTY